ncbi:TadE/TadG family type IV pilus assembly protein [Thalassovita sp.]|jgi:Flp pilus assembly protein TadG|uniref:TadE/TadG family type IV pilus assembly protein n=1 Tax=Thalassovita sp. TaxID=1979401 RepID=UPI003B59A53E
MSFKRKLFMARLRAFVEDTRGTVAIEAVLALPVLFWTFLASFVFFDAYRQNSINIKAAYMIGDVLSRETNSINDDYMDGMLSLFDYLTNANNPTKLRVTVVQWDEEDATYTRDWSKTRGEIQPLASTDLSNLAGKLPIMSDNERVILVETWSRYTPPFSVGLAQREMHNFVTTSPRFAPLLPWSNT